MKVKFIYQSDDYDLAREIVISKLCEAVSNVLELPQELIINIAYLGESVYANTAVDFRFKNRVSINNILSVIEIPEVLVHELIHVHQIHTGMLSVRRDGVYTWRNQTYNITETPYDDLPWEQDVVNKQKKVLKEALEFALKKPKN